MLVRKIMRLCVDNHKVRIVRDSKGQFMHGEDTAKGITRGLICVSLDCTNEANSSGVIGNDVAQQCNFNA